MKQIQELTTADQLAITAGDYVDLTTGAVFATGMASGSAVLFGGTFLSGSPAVLIWDML